MSTLVQASYPFDSKWSASSFMKVESDPVHLGASDETEARGWQNSGCSADTTANRKMTMPRHCKICTHPDREQIDRDLLGSQGQVAIAAKHGIAQSSVSRHLRLHLAPVMLNALGRYEETDVGRLRSWVVGLTELAVIGALKAERQDDHAATRGFIAEARKAIELTARLGGFLDGPVVHIDARQQLAVLRDLSEDELRAALAAAVPAIEPTPVIEAAPVELAG